MSESERVVIKEPGHTELIERHGLVVVVGNELESVGVGHCVLYRGIDGTEHMTGSTGNPYKESIQILVTK